MALNGITMGNAVWAEIQPYLEWDWEANIPPPPLTGVEFWQKICTKIVEHIQTNARVDTTGADPQGGTVISVGTVT